MDCNGCVIKTFFVPRMLTCLWHAECHTSLEGAQLNGIVLFEPHCSYVLYIYETSTCNSQLSLYIILYIRHVIVCVVDLVFCYTIVCNEIVYITTYMHGYVLKDQDTSKLQLVC